MEESGTRPLSFAVIGAGMAGTLAAIELEEAGYSDVTVYEKADRVGGTWRENTYPGIACDGRALPPERARASGHGQLRARTLPQRPLGPRHLSRGRARR